jgi:uncharacterized protein (DUF934 family)
MTLIRKGEVVTADTWQSATDEGPLPEGPVVVDLERWQESRDELVRRNSPVGIRLDPPDDPSLLADDLDRIELICLDFPSFTDGRAYSQARLLRERWNYRGELRATGDVLRDQFRFMRRCGFDAVETKKPADADAWDQAMMEISVAYQGRSD